MQETLHETLDETLVDQARKGGWTRSGRGWSRPKPGAPGTTEWVSDGAIAEVLGNPTRAATPASMRPKFKSVWMSRYAWESMCRPHQLEDGSVARLDDGRETAGALWGEYDGDCIVVTAATGRPLPDRQRGSCSVDMDYIVGQMDFMYERGARLLGSFHSHPTVDGQILGSEFGYAKASRQDVVHWRAMFDVIGAKADWLGVILTPSSNDGPRQWNWLKPNATCVAVRGDSSFHYDNLNYLRLEVEDMPGRGADVPQLRG